MKQNCYLSFSTEHSGLTSLSNSRKKLYRSTGSFSVLEDNTLFAPKPQRKVAITSNSQPTSPPSHRREKRRSGKQEESLFGEAGQELQTILLFSAPTTPTINEVEQEQFHEELMKELAILRHQSPCLSPPTRALNPVPMNSPFQIGQGNRAPDAVPDTVAAMQVPTHHSKVKPKITRPLKLKKHSNKQHQNNSSNTSSNATGSNSNNARKSASDLQASRARSKSWPSLSGATATFELLVA